MKPIAIAIGIAVVLVAGIALAQKPKPEPAEKFIVKSDCFARVTVRGIKTGGVIIGDLNLPWGITLREVHIVESSYDPEGGASARAALQRLVDEGTLYALPPAKGPDRDEYGRIRAVLVQITATGSKYPVADRMKAGGFTKEKAAK